MNHLDFITRRAFLAATTTLALAGCTTTPNTARVVPGKISPNERISVGLIGLGGRCRDIVETCMGIPEMRIAAVCDCFRPRVNSTVESKFNKEQWKGYIDFREMIATEKLDGVMIETTTHARAWIACHAMAAGMDVYIEKPMCLTIEEGRAMVACARKHKRVTQIGTQQRSIPLNNWASDLVLNGAIGKVTEVLAPNFVGPAIWTPQPAQPLPEGGDEGWWDIWTNQSELRPYHEDLHRRWNVWWDYDAGGRTFGVSGWGAHSYDQINRGLGTNETGPVEITLEEAARDLPAGEFKERTPGEDETGAAYYSMANISGPRAKVSMKYASGTVLKLHLDGDFGPGLGCIFVGENGRIEINRDRISATPKELISSADAPPHLAIPETEPHVRNWIDCIRSRETCTADIEYGHRSNTLCCLVNIARDTCAPGETLHWDPKKEVFKNADKANAMLSRPRRPGYELPA
ncbi:MAG: Gfo/Idh/MocA family oxidoreductase [Candidatus Hydrogenedentes bacterium]|nr:Gfo/Idh/MocA family oxidoreductase [Candidatus Hydrogenedentota bacterium]